MVESTKNDRSNGAAGAQTASQAFTFRDPVTGQVRGIKDMTDQEIDRHAAELALQLRELKETVFSSIASLSAMTAFMNLLQYEKYRRAVSIVVPLVRT